MVLVPDDLRRTLQEYRKLLEKAFGVRLATIRLFGSRARGDASSDSDADVAVVIRELTEPERTVAIDLALEARRRSRGALLSPLVWSDTEEEELIRAERRIALDIRREGIPL